MGEVEEILSRRLLAFQLCLGIWQIGKLTPVRAIVQGGMGWLLSLLPFRLSRAYALLQHSPGRVFKKMRCMVLTATVGSKDEFTPVTAGESDERCIELRYLGKNFWLDRQDGDKLLINDKMSYYITDAIWKNLRLLHTLQIMNGMNQPWVFIKSYKEFWESVVTGGVMTLSEVLDCIILENHTIMGSDTHWLLPVNLLLSEEKILKLLNLVGLFLQTRKVLWFIPTILSLASAILEFNTKVRAWVYSNINRLFCWLMHLVCDKLRYSRRRQVYSLGKWVENLKPCNDIELRVVKGNICATIAGGAKANREDATVVPWLSVEEQVTENTFHCDLIVIGCAYYGNDGCGVFIQYSDDEAALVSVDCKDRDEFAKMCTFADCMARNRSGSLKSYDGKKKVEVRGWRESVQHYARSGYPPIYELKLQNVIVNGS